MLAWRPLGKSNYWSTTSYRCNIYLRRRLPRKDWGLEPVVKEAVQAYLGADLEGWAKFEAHVVEEMVLGEQGEGLAIDGLLSEHLGGGEDQHTPQ